MDDGPRFLLTARCAFPARSIDGCFSLTSAVRACGLRHEWSALQNLCTACQKPLFAVYDLAAAGRALTREALATREKSLWRYREVLPLPLDVAPVSLGEGDTPLLRSARFGEDLGLSSLWIKDEAQNPTQSFKARGMAVAVSMAKHLGATKLAVPTAGNAGGALAAYAARAGLEAHIFMPRDTPRANVVECRELGAHVTLIDGLITDCGAEIARASHQAEATGKPFSLQQTFAAIWASGTLNPIFCPRISHTWIKTPDGWQIIGGMSCPALDRKS